MDVGGLVPFKAYDVDTHCYHAHKAAIVDYFFDRAQLQQYLASHCGGCMDCDVIPYYEPDTDGAASGTACRWYLQGVSTACTGTDPAHGPGGLLEWEQFYLNGSMVVLEAKSFTSLPDPLYLVFTFPGGGRDPLEPRFVPDPADDTQAPPWSGRPYTMQQQALRAGHIVAGVGENYGGDTFVSLQRALDAYWYLTQVRGLTFARVFTTGGSEELFVPCVDGFFRQIQWDGTELQVSVVSPAMSNVVRSTLLHDPDGNPSNGFYIICGLLPNNINHNLVQSVFIGSPPSLVTPFPGTNDQAVSVDWYDEGHTKIIVGGANTVRVLAVDDHGQIAEAAAPPLMATISGTPGPDTQAAPVGIPRAPPELCSVETGAGATPWNQLGTDYVYVSTPSGRIFILNRGNLTFPRHRAPLEDPILFGNPEWHSNRTFGHAFGATTYQASDFVPIRELVYVDDPYTPYGEKTDGKHHRVARIDPLDGTIDDVVKMIGPYGPSLVVRERDLVVARDPITQLDRYFTSVESTAVLDTGSELRQYTMFDLGSNPGGGFVFWRTGNTGLYTRLENFTIPIDSAVHHLDDYAYLPDGRIPGQVSTMHGASANLYHGHAVQVGDLRKNGTTVPHVVVGTIGGFVYALDATHPPGNGLSYYSLDQGWHVVGMDIGDVDSTVPGNELVIGTLMDTGSRDDYEAGSLTMNRGALVILKTATESMGNQVPFEEERLNIVGCGNDPTMRMTSGFFGVKIDDVNGDGHNEIWVGDAAGHLYLLYRPSAGAPFQCFFRSRSLGAFAGLYNQIFPIKDAQHKTTHLILFTAGYVYRFSVVNSQLPTIS
ncbi:MAG: hypothetical protein U1E76_07275 [Planctomycetota bacterium]